MTDEEVIALVITLCTISILIMLSVLGDILARIANALEHNAKTDKALATPEAKP